MTEQLLIIGNGMASVRLVEALIRRAPGQYDITVVGAEKQAGYNRVLLSALLAADVTAADIELRDADWYARNGIHLITGDAVTSMDAEARIATLASGKALHFDRCVFATGSNAIRLPLPGADLEGVITFRDLSHVAAMEQAALAERNVAVIGGGLLGIEAAYGLARRGAKVTLIHVMDRLMERQLDAEAAAYLLRAIRAKGIRVLLNRQSERILGTERVTGIAFKDGEQIVADMVVFAAGIRPNAALAASAGLATNRGIIVDDVMAANLPGFYAVGECAEHRGIAYGLVEPCYAQAEVLAAHLAGEPASFDGMVLATNLKVSGVLVFSAGDFMGAGGTHSVVMQDRAAGAYRKLVFRGEQLVGCVLMGEAEDGLWLLDLIRQGSDISAMRAELIHGREHADAALAEAMQAAA
ncbi:MAG: NAD(P)/FAD-dependent oxidoreductase [Bosea sp. (in: a-proteobacteria)]